nr:MbcA/ParS/Xre antitoxin family protein [Halomonas sp. 1513]
MLDAEAVLDYVVNVFEDADIAREWLHCEVPALSGSRPVDLVGTSRGRQSIREALGKIECGEFS